MNNENMIYQNRINRIDQAIYESEQEIANGAEALDAEVFFAEREEVAKSLFGILSDSIGERLEKK